MTKEFSKWKSTDKEKDWEKFTFTAFTLLIIDDKCSSLLNLETVPQQDLAFFIQVDPGNNSTFL